MFRAAAILLLIGVPALAQRYPFRNYGQEQGLTNLNPKCIVQDRIGFLWVGTQNGLYRYDGGRFEYFGVEHGLPANRVEALHEARDGTLWVGTTSGLARMTGDRFAAVPISSDTASVNSVGSDGQGRLFVGLDSGLAVGTVSEKETQFRVHLPPTEGRSVTGLHSEGSERTWFWCDKRICYYQSGQITVVSPELVPARRRSASVIVDRSGAVIARNGSTLFSMPKDTTRFERQETELPPSTESSALFLDNEGRLLAPTNAGIGRRNANGIWEYFGNNRGLLINQTTTVFQDREGSIWVGLAGAGIARWVGYGQWESWDSDDGLKSDAVWAIARDLKGTLWAGTESGLQYLTRSAAGNPRWVEKPVAPRRIDTIVPAKNGSTWVGSSAGLFARVDGRDGAAIGYGPDQGLANNRVHHAVFDAQDRLWVATAGGLFVGRVGAGPVRFSKMEIPGDDPSAVYERFLVDRDGQLWIGGSSGLSRFAAERWTRFGERDGLLKQPISRLAQSSDGSIWAGYTGGYGISRITFSEGKMQVQQFTSKDGLRSNQAIALTSDRNGRLWYATDAGVQFRDGQRWRSYGRQDGLIWDDCNGNALFADEDGSVWIGTSMGLSHFRLPSVELAQLPQVVVTAAEFGGKPQQLATPVSIPFGDRTANIRFAALTFRNESAVTFRYRLLGFDDEWVETPAREVRFPKLPSGSYTFEVSARAGDGGWSTSVASLPFKIQAAWWGSWYFLGGIALLLALLARSLWTKYARRRNAADKELREQLDQRSAELALQREALEQERTTSAEKDAEIERISTDAQAASGAGAEALAGMAQQVRVPIAGAIGMVDLVLESHLTPPQQQNLQLARLSASNALTAINEAVDLSRIESGTLELDRVDFHLRDYLQQVIGQFAQKAHEKNLALTCRIVGKVHDGITGDPARLRRVLTTLLGSALKNTEKGEIAVEVNEDSREADDSILHFKVRDTSAGLTDEQRERALAGPLRIMILYANAMGGDLWFDTEASGGTICHVTARLGRHSRASAPAQPRAALARSLRVLIGDDNMVNQKLLASMLQKRGHIAAVANSRKELDAAATKQFDAVVLSLDSQDVEALEFARAARGAEEQSTVRIIALSSVGTAELREAAADAGVDEYLVLPLTGEDLIRAIMGPPPEPRVSATAVKYGGV